MGADYFCKKSNLPVEKTEREGSVKPEPTPSDVFAGEVKPGETLHPQGVS
jgi:hypothetical protein